MRALAREMTINEKSIRDCMLDYISLQNHLDTDWKTRARLLNLYRLERGECATDSGNQDALPFVIVHLPLCGLQRVVTLFKVRIDACNSLFSHFHGGRNLLIVKSWIEVLLLLEGDTLAKLQDHSLHAGVDTAGVASTAEGSKNVSFLRSHRTKIDNPPFSVTVQIMGGYIKTIAKSARCAWFKEGHHYIICPQTLCNLDHILQGCIRSKKLIIEIENDSQSMLTQSIQRQGFTTHIGCVVPFRDICIRPNILAVRGECLVVEEPIIVTDKGMLTYYEDEKLSRYGNGDAMEVFKAFLNLPPTYSTTIVHFVANWRGIISKNSSTLATTILNIPPLFLKYIKLQILSSSHRIYRSGDEADSEASPLQLLCF
ncbi:unnamed protein product [Lepeophtheirus salmonis]|uniref:(salmon louse) hypothetical protein n=1 Tax=Lepeophtheirus salmonis TaxID=72036 RepID=A0A817FDK9_LEPSM|nr:unnamed protein product [Lepeophtheirus salmonis]CAG9477242.1 unnamed protein product [Lepeophtheirus salmonis]